MTRLLSSVVLAGALALSMSSVASAREGRPGDHHGGPRCKIVKSCKIVKVGHHRVKRVCTNTKVCGDHHGHH